MEHFTMFTDHEAKLYMYLAFKALDEIHSAGIIHRDIKPQNIIYCPEKKTLKLVDFGYLLALTLAWLSSTFLNRSTLQKWHLYISKLQS